MAARVSLLAATGLLAAAFHGAAAQSTVSPANAPSRSDPLSSFTATSAQVAAQPGAGSAATVTGTTWQEIRVQIVARNAASLAAPMSGRLTEFPLRDGDRFTQGQVIARFHCGEQEGAAARARALLHEKREVLNTNSRLQKLGTGSNLDFQVALAQVEEAAAQVQMATVAVDNCAVQAPFAGRVAAVAARRWQFVPLGAPMIDILDDKALDVEMIVPSRWLSWLGQGAEFNVAIDETGKTYPAVVDRLSGRVDAVSQTVKLYASLKNPGPELLAGMSGQALLAPPISPAPISPAPVSPAPISPAPVSPAQAVRK